MATVSEILKIAHSLQDRVHTIGPNISLREVGRILDEKDVGALPVIEDGQLIGIISERDLARKVIPYSIEPYTTTVRSYMSEKLITVSPSDDLMHCMDLMKKNKIRHLPVVENGKLIGMVSIRDILETINSELRDSNENFLRFIYGNR